MTRQGTDKMEDLYTQTDEGPVSTQLNIIELTTHKKGTGTAKQEM